MKVITCESIAEFGKKLEGEEKAGATVEKYLRDVKAFAAWLNGKRPEKHDVVRYKEYLIGAYAPSSVNSVLSSINKYFSFCGNENYRAKFIKVQRRIFIAEEKELTKEEYRRLLYAAERKGKKRLKLIMQSVCSTGIRISELRFITVEAAKKGYADVACKGKRRKVLLPDKLCRLLRSYAEKENIASGSVFVTAKGKKLNRSNLWASMKKLCSDAGVSPEKVFPHNLRHLFARTFYSRKKDIVRLADVLGHSNINTTRIYTLESGKAHRRQIQSLDLL